MRPIHAEALFRRRGLIEPRYVPGRGRRSLLFGREVGYLIRGLVERS